MYTHLLPTSFDKLPYLSVKKKKITGGIYVKPNRNHLTLRRLNKDMTFYFIMPCLKLNTIIDWSEFHRGPASVDPGLVSRAPRRKNLFAVSSLVKHRNRLFIIVIIWFYALQKCTVIPTSKHLKGVTSQNPESALNWPSSLALKAGTYGGVFTRRWIWNYPIIMADGQ